MTLKHFLTSASIAAIVATPLAVNAAGNERVGEAPENVVQSTDDTTINNEESSIEPNELGNERVGTFQADANASSAGDSPFEIQTIDSMELADATKDDASPLVGKSVTTIDGTPLGNIEGVYTDVNGMTFAEVSVDPKLGADTDSFLVGINADASQMDGIQLQQTQAEFAAELKQKVGTTTGQDAQDS
ncbi:hypothetical protein [Pseudooceanicola sp. LIPI14-2-Ac024]|uniref:hypothetical protein n=1 Tax=Pseudooceanicola sp. LIPI14-2-Ac024 TaxID=3344875 RepID=UPI0035CECC85